MKQACVIGWPIEQSRSPLIHGHWLKTYGIAGRYDRVAVPVGEAGAFVRSLEAHGLEGCNVTAPHKQAVFEAADWRDPSAEAVGAGKHRVAGWRQGLRRQHRHLRVHDSSWPIRARMGQEGCAHCGARRRRRGARGHLWISRGRSRQGAGDQSHDRSGRSSRPAFRPQGRGDCVARRGGGNPRCERSGQHDHPWHGRQRAARS